MARAYPGDHLDVVRGGNVGGGERRFLERFLEKLDYTFISINNLFIRIYSLEQESRKFVALIDLPLNEDSSFRRNRGWSRCDLLIDCRTSVLHSIFVSKTIQ